MIPGGVDVTDPLPLPLVSTARLNTALNPAVTDCAAVIVTVHVPEVFVQAPAQPLKTEPVPGVAVSVTTAPLPYVAVQVAPQSMPVGVDVTTPAPSPVLETVRSAPVSNVAVTAVTAVIVTVHGLDCPAQAPPHPANVDAPVGVPVSVTWVPFTKRSEQSAPQLMPMGLDVTVPVPPPARVTVSTEPTTVGVGP